MKQNISNKKFISGLEKHFVKEMPRIHKEIKVYETNLKNGKLKTSPKIAPQFNR